MTLKKNNRVRRNVKKRSNLLEHQLPLRASHEQRASLLDVTCNMFRFFFIVRYVPQYVLSSVPWFSLNVQQTACVPLVFVSLCFAQVHPKMRSQCAKDVLLSVRKTRAKT